jgi:hypothetical protein
MAILVLQMHAEPPKLSKKATIELADYPCESIGAPLWVSTFQITPSIRCDEPKA